MTNWDAGTEVRLVSDPGMIGICTGLTRERAGTLHVQVAFPVFGRSYQPSYELERINDVSNDPYTLIRQGRYGAATHLRRHLTHIQLSGKLANLVYSMETTHTDFYAYQYKPVLSFLESPSNGLLIADEVGLGKTIEAGLIWTELRARLDARRLLVLCPAMLREKWQLELSSRFGIDAEIVDARDLLQRLQRARHDHPDGRALVGSFQGLRPPRGWRDDDPNEGEGARQRLTRFLRDNADAEPLVDLLVIDEAHYLRNPESLTNKLGHLLRDVSEHVVLLSATPINLSNDDLFHLLNLVDPDSFRFKEYFPDLLVRNEPLIRARDAALRMDSTEEDIKSLLRAISDPSGLDEILRPAESRSLKALLDTPMPREFLAQHSNRVRVAGRIERLNHLDKVVNRTRKAEVTEFRTVRRPNTEKIPMTEAEARFYTLVTETIRRYALEHGLSDGFLLASPQRQVSSSMVAAARAWHRYEPDEEFLYESFGAEVEDLDEAPLIETLAREVLPEIDVAELEEHDSKYDRLRHVLRKHFAEQPADKIILFSYFRGTLRYLEERLARDGITSLVLMGGNAGQPKQQVIDEFRERPEIRVLLSSEVAAEGVDLQFCRVVVNYDLPWNPMKVEQRIGRVDRIGQQADTIVVWNLCAEGTIDERILTRLYERLRLFERALGGFEAILGEQIKALTSDLLSRQLTAEEEGRRIEQTALAIENIREQQEQLEAQAASLIAHGGYVLDEVHAAHDFSRRITDQDLFVYVRDYLQRHAPGHTLQQIGSDPPEYEVGLPGATVVRFADFIRHRRLGGQTQLATGERRRCRFVNKVQLRRQQVEQISQFHPLIRFVSEELTRLNEAFFPLLAVRIGRETVSPLIPSARYVFSVKRWSFGGLRTEEELRARVVTLGAGRAMDADASLNLVNQARAYGDDWPSAGNVLAADAVTQALDLAEELVAADFNQNREEKENRNHDRVGMQKQALEQHRARRMEQLSNTLQSHKTLGRAALAAATEGQIGKLNQRIDTQLEVLTQKASLTHSQIDMCVGVIEVG